MQSFVPLALAVLLAFALAPASVQAQSVEYDPNVSPEQQFNSKDKTYSPPAQAGSLNFSNLIHQSNLANPRSLEQYGRDRDRKLDEAITKFRGQNVRITPEIIESPPPAPTP